jgi:hypothetical protein
MLGFIVRDNSLSISSNLLLKIILNKGINLNILYNYILKYIGYLIYLSIVSILYYKEGRGYKKGGYKPLWLKTLLILYRR